MNFQKTIFLLFSLTIFSCSKNKEPPKATINNYHVQGDPLSLLEGATLKDSPITYDELSQFDGYILSGGNVFIQKLKKENKATREELKEQQTPTNQSRITTGKQLYLKKQGDKYIYTDDKESIRIQFVKDEKGLLVLEKYDEYEAQLVNFSVASDKEVFSITIKTKTKENGNVLFSLSFYKNKFSTLNTDPKNDYYYLYGQGVKVKWPDAKKLKISTCGKWEYTKRYLVEKAVSQWNYHLSGDVIITYSHIESGFPSIFDIGTNCIYSSSIFTENLTAGITLFTSDLKAGLFYNSDIVLMDKYLDKYEDEDYQEVVEHELGHFLGLHHNFEEGAFSIMSYTDYYDDEISTYDIKATKSLYYTPVSNDDSDSDSDDVTTISTEYGY